LLYIQFQVDDDTVDRGFLLGRVLEIAGDPGAGLEDPDVVRQLKL